MKDKKQKKYTLVSLFAGCGGLDLGFTGGFEILGKKYAKRNSRHFRKSKTNQLTKNYAKRNQRRSVSYYS